MHHDNTDPEATTWHTQPKKTIMHHDNTDPEATTWVIKATKQSMTASATTRKAWHTPSAPPVPRPFIEFSLPVLRVEAAEAEDCPTCGTNATQGKPSYYWAFDILCTFCLSTQGLNSWDSCCVESEFAHAMYDIHKQTRSKEIRDKIQTILGAYMEDRFL